MEKSDILEVKEVPIQSLIVDKEFSEVVPAPSEEDYSSLKDSIAEHGFNSYLIVMPKEGEDNKYIVIDGHTRLRILKEIGGFKTVPVQILYPESRVDALKMVIRFNLSRRQLSASQRAILIAELNKIYDAEIEKAHERIVQGAKKRWDNNITIPDKGKTAEKLGKQAGVSEKLVRIARQVVEKSPELAKKVKNGDLSVQRAQKINRYKEIEKQREEKKNEITDQTTVTGTNTYSYKSYVQVFKGIKDVHTCLFFDTRIPADPRIFADDAIAYYIVPSAKVMNALVQIEASGLKLDSIIAVAKNRGSVLFMIKGIKGNPLQIHKKIQFVKGTRMDAVYFACFNSTVEQEQVFMLNPPDYSVVALVDLLKRKFIAVEDDEKTWRKNQEDKAVKMVKAQEVIDKYNRVPNPEVSSLMKWFWLELRGLPEEQYNTSPKNFFAKEGKASRALLANNSIEQVQALAKAVHRDSFWKDKLTLTVLQNKWPEFFVKYRNNLPIGFDDNLKEIEDESNGWKKI